MNNAEMNALHFLAGFLSGGTFQHPVFIRWWVKTEVTFAFRIRSQWFGNRHSFWLLDKRWPNKIQCCRWIVRSMKVGLQGLLSPPNRASAVTIRAHGYLEISEWIKTKWSHSPREQFPGEQNSKVVEESVLCHFLVHKSKSAGPVGLAFRKKMTWSTLLYNLRRRV